MKRDFARLRGGRFDLLVVGGGIYGAWAAYDAALRGLSVGLVERRDWGAGTSSASSKLVHGGLRYLESFRILLVRKTLAERRRLAALGPHRVSPLRFLLPVHQGDRYGRLRLTAGLALYDRLGRGPESARHRRLSRAQTLKVAPFLAAEDLLGGFEFGDCVTDDARLTLEIVSGALDAGAVAVNHAEVTALLETRGRVEGALVVDRESGGDVELRASLVLDASGAWSDALRRGLGTPRLTRTSKGVHLLLPSLTRERALFLWARSDARPIFLIPWYGKTLLGTTDTDYTGEPDALAIEEQDVRYLLSEANRVLDGRRFGPGDVLGAFAGLRSLPNVPARSPSAVSRAWFLEEPLPGLLVSVGGKLTSARADAARAVERALAVLGKSAGVSPTRSRPFPWRPEEPIETFLERSLVSGVALGLDPETAETAARRYGATVFALHAILRERPALAARIEQGSPFCLAEIVHAARSEMATTLEDLLRRRIPVSLFARLDAERLAAAADLAAETLGWTPERRAAELAKLARP